MPAAFTVVLVDLVSIVLSSGSAALIILTTVSCWPQQHPCTLCPCQLFSNVMCVKTRETGDPQCSWTCHVCACAWQMIGQQSMHSRYEDARCAPACDQPFLPMCTDSASAPSKLMHFALPGLLARPAHVLGTALLVLGWAAEPKIGVWGKSTYMCIGAGCMCLGHPAVIESPCRVTD